jgi:hypothetical protein
MITNCSNFNPTYETASGIEAVLYASSTCEIQNPTSSVASVENGFTYGEVVIGAFQFLIFLNLLTMSLILLFRGFKFFKRV